MAEVNDGFFMDGLKAEDPKSFKSTRITIAGLAFDRKRIVLALTDVKGRRWLFTEKNVKRFWGRLDLRKAKPGKTVYYVKYVEPDIPANDGVWCYDLLTEEQMKSERRRRFGDYTLMKHGFQTENPFMS